MVTKANMTKASEAPARKSEAVKRALQALERAGKLTAEDVVGEARKKTSPLHDFFEWDDSKAAESWRLEQARGLIRSVLVKVTTEDSRVISVPVYVRDPTAKDDEQGYAVLASIQSNPKAAKAALYVELVRVEGLLTRAESIAEVCGLAADVVKVAKRVSALRRRVQPVAQA